MEKYPCFSAECNFESDTFEGIETHITEKHSAEVLTDTRRVMELINQKFATRNQPLEQIKFIPVSYLKNKPKLDTRITAGYSRDEKAFWIKAESDVKGIVMQDQAKFGYRYVTNTDKIWIFAKKVKI